MVDEAVVPGRGEPERRQEGEPEQQMGPRLALVPAAGGPGADRDEGDDERAVRAQQEGDDQPPSATRSAPPGQSAGRWYIWPTSATPAAKIRAPQVAAASAPEVEPRLSSRIATPSAPATPTSTMTSFASRGISSQFAATKAETLEAMSSPPNRPSRAGSLKPPSCASERRMAAALSGLTSPSPTQRPRSASSRLR